MYLIGITTNIYLALPTSIILGIPYHDLIDITGMYLRRNWYHPNLTYPNQDRYIDVTLICICIWV